MWGLRRFLTLAVGTCMLMVVIGVRISSVCLDRRRGRRSKGGVFVSDWRR